MKDYKQWLSRNEEAKEDISQYVKQLKTIKDIKKRIEYLKRTKQEFDTKYSTIFYSSININ